MLRRSACGIKRSVVSASPAAGAKPSASANAASRNLRATVAIPHPSPLLRRFGANPALSGIIHNADASGLPTRLTWLLRGRTSPIVLPLTLPSPPVGERVEQGWRGAAEPYPELGEGVSCRGGDNDERRRHRLRLGAR